MEDLMKPRYKQIADWPFMGNRYAIGNVFSFDTEVEAGIMAAYPHLFKRMEWWEGRSNKDMPPYFKKLSTGMIYLAKKWRLNDEQGWVAHSGRNVFHKDGIVPISKEEYELTKNGLLDGK